MRRPESDPYLPGHGDPSFGVDHYHLELDYSLESNRLSGRATLDVRAHRPVRELTLDLHALKVVKVAGDLVGKHIHTQGRLRLRLRRELAAGEGTSVTITYRGVPSPVPDAYGSSGWEELSDGVIVASQPAGAPSWYPCNNRPDDKATYTISMTAPSDYLVIANGERTGRRRGASRTTWTYQVNEPMPPYLASVQIGRYAESELTTPGSRRAWGVRILAAVPPELGRRFATAFADQAAMMDFFTGLFGPYPFSCYRVVITADSLEIPLESHGMSVFGSNLLNRSWDAQRLIAHELAHQWFGNAVTMRSLKDVWLHEGFACYCEWLWSEQSGGPSADARAREHWRRLPRHREVLGAPGPEHVFDDWVYKRGALTLHALRLTVGDKRFFGLLREWVARFSGRNVTTADFVALACGQDGNGVGRLLDEWIYQPGKPELPSAPASSRPPQR